MDDPFRTYTLVFSLPPKAEPPSGARRLGREWYLDFRSDDFASIPTARKAIEAAGGGVIHESGARITTDHDPTWTGGRFVLPSHTADGALRGVSRGTERCSTCGLPIVTLSVSNPSVELAEPLVLAQTSLGILLIAMPLRDRLGREGLDEGAEFIQVSGDACIVIPSRRVRAGLSERSAACEQCGRILVEIDGSPTPVPARYSIAQSMAAPRGEGWWSHPATGDALCLASEAVMRLLVAAGASVREQRVPDVTDSSAWLEEELR